MNAAKLYDEISSMKKVLKRAISRLDKSTRKNNNDSSLDWRKELKCQIFHNLYIEEAGNIVFTLNYLMNLNRQEAIKLLPMSQEKYVQLRRILDKPVSFTIHCIIIRISGYESPYTFFHLGKKAWLIAKLQDGEIDLYFTGKNVVKYYLEYRNSYKNWYSSRRVIRVFDSEDCLWKSKRIVNTEDGVRKYVFDEKVESIIRELRNFMEVAKKMYHDFKVPKSTGLLLYGPPGSGKTTLVKYIARQLDLPLYYASPEDLMAIIEVGEQHVNDDPRIIVFEDIDVVCDKRDGDEEARKRFNLMLQYLDGVHTPPNVIFIATTNYPEKLDNALTRNGRFGRKYEMNYFDKETALKYCKLNNLPESILADVLYPVSPAYLEEKLIDWYYNNYLKESED